MNGSEGIWAQESLCSIHVRFSKEIEALQPTSELRSPPPDKIPILGRKSFISENVPPQPSSRNHSRNEVVRRHIEDFSISSLQLSVQSRKLSVMDLFSMQLPRATHFQISVSGIALLPLHTRRVLGRFQKKHSSICEAAESMKMQQRP